MNCNYRCILLAGKGVVFASAALLFQTAYAQISWIIPLDGGTPRETNRIQQLGTNEFRIRAAFEEGGRSVLRHAVSRVDLICQNTGSEAVTVTVHLDLSDDGQRTDYDNRPEAGMRWRDFLFIQPPNHDWQQINGTTEGWIATIRFQAPPGETKVGLSPWYTYGDYLRFVRSLPDLPHLVKGMRATSDGGREHWELTITDPEIASDQKRTIFWHAREHGYETWSSFAMEGLVEFLLSDASAEFRRRFVFVLHPMTNVDGVALGYEYRGGYDFPSPRATASGRFILETVDRWRPHFAVAWHNWIAPRDRNVVFYTDGQDGEATARAWWRFTQFFPSLQAAGHRWKDEATPLRYNWEGRQPLSDANVHQYAMKKYGTRIWGWEMPWWNYSVPEARAFGAAFANAFLRTIEEIRTDSVPPAERLPHLGLPRWEMHEFVLKGTASVANPYRDAALVGEFAAPSGRTNIVAGFYDGGEIWRLRFAPDEEGTWKYKLRGEGVEILAEGRVNCTKARDHGFIGVHPENPYAFAYSDGTPFFPMGDTCYGLFDDSPITPALRERYLRTRRAQQFNFVRLTVGHSEARAAREPEYWAWGGTPQQPDLDRFNPEFFGRFDQFMHELRAEGMNVELILLNFYRRPFLDPRLWTATRERQWLRYLLARYGAFDNVFMWTLANEYETRPDGKYRLDFPEDVNWAKTTARYLKENDGFAHCVTVHPVISASRTGNSPRSPFEPPWRIGEFFGEADGIDVISQQTGQSGVGVVWDESLQCWRGDAASLGASIRTDRRFKKPVLNTESGYEYLRGDSTSKRQVHHTDKVRRSAWRIVCSGGYFAAGFHGTIGHSDVWNRIDPTSKYTFILRDEGAASQLRLLYEFFAALPYWRMQPFDGVTKDALALSLPGEVYVIYFPAGGTTMLDLSDYDREFTARWFNPRTGESSRRFSLNGGNVQPLKPPDSEDWALLVRASTKD